MIIHIKDKDSPIIQQPLVLDKEVHQRDKFNNQFEYLLSVLGFAAGFGSVWRFPYLIFKNGGGVFLIPYMILFFLVGVPSFYFETSIGQIFQKGPPQIFQKIHKKWKGLGFLPIINTAIMSTYYNLILAYSFYYLWESFKFPLPWKIDENLKHIQPWNKDFFYNNVLQSTGSINNLGGIVWPLFFCYVLSQVIVQKKKNQFIFYKLIKINNKGFFVYKKEFLFREKQHQQLLHLLIYCYLYYYYVVYVSMGLLQEFHIFLNLIGQKQQILKYGQTLQTRQFFRFLQAVVHQFFLAHIVLKIKKQRNHQYLYLYQLFYVVFCLLLLFFLIWDICHNLQEQKLTIFL
ncbi:hypothetical protein IMG5_021560 [Ichthyophthirius multifiliis]|uniref:Transporter n=1 Tax=Ichthyophthirius multifiliis TaxID=5932 RepID=G0QKT2_ICHMU|nr:hypothetical protein IMG5_021560 [Ichthyophthirius multifiliis]EGR34175.1 hypothetical protein IMG5_021560 [Ichthyophthirius multifiliis]|eukprot:XP_004039479.1 hypothetical protein IMG5_021560 [Ichthyophthirius multifiliis]